MKYLKTFESIKNFKKPLTIAIRKFLTRYYGETKMYNLFTILSSLNITVEIEAKKDVIMINFENYKKNEDLINFIKLNLDNRKIEYRNFVLAFGTLKFIFNKNLINDLIDMFETMEKTGEFDNVINARKFNL